MKAQSIGRLAIQAASGIVDMATVAIIALLLAFSAYALWDSQQVFQAADSANYTAYKPAITGTSPGFAELQALNPEVIAWLTVYRTNIDYPVTQGPDNMKYVNTSAEGRYSLSGAIFLDCANSPDFSDFNSILYGHHMDKNLMFGQLGDFADKNVFDSHRYGSLTFGGQAHGVEFFAFLHTDAYDGAVFSANVSGAEARQAYLDGLLAKASHRREIGVTIDDHIILLSTCSSASTNGRDILVGRISDELFADPFADVDDSGPGLLAGIDSPEGFWVAVSAQLPLWLLLLCLVPLLVLALVFIHKRKKSDIDIESELSEDENDA